MYVPLKVTTDYSLLKSLIKIPELINFLLEKNIKVCGICDDNLYGVFDFYNACKNNRIKPIVGLSIKIKDLEIYLYAKNYLGYKNLLKIHTIKEKRDLLLDDLIKYKDNILVILPYESRNIFNELNNIFNVYMGYKSNIERINELKVTSKVIFVNDIRFLKKEDMPYMKYLDLLRKNEIKDYNNCYYLSDLEYPGVVDEFINQIDLKFNFNEKYIPKYIDNSYEFLKNLSFKGLNKRLNGNVSDKYIKRLEYELDVINKMGFVDYFLIVYDYVLYAKKNNILVGPGRGSAAGSLVSYSIGITDIDPLKYGLMFERFLNPERVTMPDIDIDFDAYKREEVIKYVKHKYGENKVALGLTFNTLKSKLVLRDIGKILNINNNLLDGFIKNINGSLGLKNNLNNEVIKKYINNYKEIKKLYGICLHLEDLKKNTSVHAAGVVISSIDLDEVIPIHIMNETLITGCTMDYLENIGLLKMDFLAVKNLSMIANILDVIGHDKLKNINLNDMEVYKLFASGKTDGIFQFETPLLKSLIMKLKPTCFDDLVAGIALGRPGALMQVDNYILRKNGQEKIDYIDKSLEKILKDTYGIILYQEQIMAILRIVGSYSLAQADIIRRAISKKKENIIKEEKEKFIRQAIKNGYNEALANEIYGFIIKFANYGFNKSHSVAYALVAYQMAYLKVKYPEYFIIEMINSKDGNVLNNSINYLKNKGFKLIKPDINLSKNNYYVKGKSLIMPFREIKGVSKELAEKIMLSRKEEFLDIFDFFNKTKDFVNRDVFEILIKAGVFDSFNINRHTLIENVDTLLNYVNLNDENNSVKRPMLLQVNEYDLDTLKDMEYEAYGRFISNHPSSKYKDCFKLENMDKYLFKNVKCVVLVEGLRSIKTKKNEDMAFMSGSDETKVGDFTIFPKNYGLLNDIKVHDLVEVNGTVSKRFDKISIIVNNIKKVGKNE